MSVGLREKLQWNDVAVGATSLSMNCEDRCASDINVQSAKRRRIPVNEALASHCKGMFMWGLRMTQSSVG